MNVFLEAAKNAFLQFGVWAILGAFVLFMALAMGVSLLWEWGDGKIREKFFKYAFYMGAFIVAFLSLVYVHETGRLLW